MRKRDVSPKDLRRNVKNVRKPERAYSLVAEKSHAVIVGSLDPISHSLSYVSEPCKKFVAALCKSFKSALKGFGISEQRGDIIPIVSFCGFFIKKICSLLLEAPSASSVRMIDAKILVCKIFGRPFLDLARKA